MVTRTVRDVDLHTIVDTNTTPNIIYIGKANHGVSETEASWFIRRISTATGADIESVGVDFDQIWANRTSLVYT